MATHEDAVNLLKMTPHYYHNKKERRGIIDTLPSLDVTIDLRGYCLSSMKYHQKGNDLVLIIDEVFDHQDLETFFITFTFQKKAIHLLHRNKGYKINNEYQQRFILHKGDILTLHAYDPDDGNPYEPNFEPIDIAYEDELLFIVNKPADLPVYPSDLSHHQSLAHRVALAMVFPCRKDMICQCVLFIV